MEKFDAIVVGAGPSGVASAYTMAKAGLNVVIIERGEVPGTKNVMGAILYRQPTERIIQDFWKEAPLERPIIEQRIVGLTKDSAITLCIKDNRFGAPPYNSFTIMRANFDKWFANKAVEAGAILINETTVNELIMDGARVVGVRTGREEGDIYADVTVVAEGANSLLSKKAGLHPEIPPHDIALAVKEVIFFPRQKIEDRFGIRGEQGVAIELIGEITAGMTGIGFIYTNKDSLSVGLGCLISDFMDIKITPYDLLDHMKGHPYISPMLEGGEVKEYSAHLIPEGGYNAIPPLYKDGLLVVGDAAMLVNALFREGSNLAMTSGLCAAQTVIEAKKKNDYSCKTLSRYRDLLDESFVIKDLKRLANMGHIMNKNKEFFTLYPSLVADIFYKMLTVDSVPKYVKQRRAIIDFLRKRPIPKLLGDAIKMWKAGMLRW